MKKTKICNRILSLMLSIVIVIAMVPTDMFHLYVHAASDGTQDTVTQPVDYNIDIPDYSNAIVSAAPSVAAAGETVYLHVIPDKGWGLVSLTVMQGETSVETSKENDSCYSFTMPEGNVTVEAAFKEVDKYSISIDEGISGGSVTTDITEAYELDTVQLKVSADKGYVLETLKYNNTEITADKDGNYSFIMPGAVVSITAAFVEHADSDHTWDNGICAVCGTEHTDHTWVSSICSKCQLVCEHASSSYFDEDRKCNICGITGLVASRVTEDGTEYYHYTTLQEAVEASQSGDTVTLYADYTLSENLTVPEGVTLVVRSPLYGEDENVLLTFDAGVKLINNGTVYFATTFNFGGSENNYTGDGALKIGSAYASGDGKFIDGKLYYNGDDYNAMDNSFYWAAGDGYILYEPAEDESGDWVMTLNNATYQFELDGKAKAAFLYSNNLIINFEGENTLSATGSNGIVLYATNNLENEKATTTMNGVDEGAVLNIIGENDNKTGNAVSLGELYVNSGTVNISADAAAAGAKKINVGKDAVINFTGTETISFGLGCDDITVENGGSLYAAGGLGGIFVSDSTTASCSGNINAVTVTMEQSSNEEDGSYTVDFEYSISGKTSLSQNLDPYNVIYMYELENDASVTTTVTFTVPAGTSLTVPGDITLDLSKCDVDDIDFSGSVINNGTINLPDGYKILTLNGNSGNYHYSGSGIVNVGEKSYTWDNVNNKWICCEGNHSYDEKSKCTVCGYIGGHCGLASVNSGKDVNWTFNETTGTVTVSGTGAMKDFGASDAPWKQYIDKITAVVIEDGVTTVGMNAFSSCLNLGSVELGKDIETIKTGAFAGCEKITSLHIPASLTSFSMGSFSGLKGLTTITVDQDNTSFKAVDNVLFTADGEALLLYPSQKADENYMVPEGVVELGYMAFEANPIIKTVILSDTVKVIDERVFMNNDNLETVIIPNEISSIAKEAFYNCSKLKTVHYLGTKNEWNNKTKHSQWASPAVEAHFAAEIEKVAANCTTAGHEAGIYCDSCAAYITGGTVLPIDENNHAGETYRLKSGTTDAIETVCDCGEKVYSTYVLKVPETSYYDGKERTAAVEKDGTALTDAVIVYKDADGEIVASVEKAGTYTAEYTLDGVTATAQFEIEKRPVTATITVKDKDYDGTPTATVDSIVINNKLATDVDLTVTGGELTFADEKAGVNKSVAFDNNWTLTGSNAENYVLAEKPANATATIRKVLLTVTANDNRIIYGDEPAGNGVIYSNFANNETADVLGGTLTYEYNYEQYGDVGSDYTITPKGLTSDNYEIEFLAGTLLVKAKEIGIAWGDAAFTYDGNAKAPEATATGTVNGDVITLTVEGAQTEASASAYTATVTGITGDKADNYKLPADVTTTFTIGTASQKAPEVGYSNETVDGANDGKITGVNSTMEWRADGKDDYTAIDEGVTELTDLADGTYYVRYAAKENYDASPDATVAIGKGNKLTVTVPANPTGYKLTVDKTALTWNDSVTLTFTLADGYSKTETFAVKVNGSAVELDANGKYTVSNVQGDVIITVEGVADITAPEAEIKIGDNIWNTLLNKITFGKFFKETQKVEITAADVNTGTGLDKIYYYLATEEVSDFTSVVWTEYTGSFNIEPNAEVIIYAWAEDHAGNDTYISSEGLVLDSIAPVITDITDGATYYGTTGYEVDETYVASVTDNDSTVTLANGKATIAADGNAHVIIVTDKAGNTATVTVTVKPVEDMNDSITVDDSNVTSDDKEEIQAVIDSIDNILNDENSDLTEEEKAELEELREEAQDLLDKIAETEKAVEDAVTDADGFKADEVTSDDKGEIEDLVKEIEDLIASDNTTDEQKAELEDAKDALKERVQEIEDAAQAVEDAKAPVKDITSDNVTADDSDELEKAKETLEELKEDSTYTEEEKAAIQAEIDRITELEEVIAETEEEVKAIEEKADALDPDKVTSSDKAEVEQFITEMEDKLSNPNMTEEQKERVEESIDEAEAIIEKIEADQKALEEALTDQKAVTEENVTGDDSEALADAKETLEELKQDDNYTVAEKEVIQEEIDRITELEEKIAEVAKEVSDLKETADSYDKDTVTSKDKDALEDLIEDAEALLETDNLTDEQKETVEAVKADAEELVKEIEDAASDITTEDVKEVEDITSENVGLDDKENLEEALEDLKAALEENDGNYTDEEKAAIEEDIARMEDALESIEKAETVIDQITELPDVDDVETDDEDVVTDVQEIVDAYDKLTDHEKSLIDEELISKLEDVQDKLSAYKIIAGADGFYTKGSSDGLEFTANGAFSKFTGIKVDGTVVAEDNYTAEAGSTVITLKASYLETLTTGKHELTAVYTDGEASCNFEVKAQVIVDTDDDTDGDDNSGTNDDSDKGVTSPDTGDHSNVGMWSILMMLSAAGIITIVSKKRKRY